MVTASPPAPAPTDEPRLLGWFEPNTPDWHAARRWRIGGSEIAVVMGWSPFQTREELLAQKLSGASTEVNTKATLRGHLLEPAILAWGAHAKGYQYDQDASTATWLHPLWDFALYNPDSLTLDGLLIECKSVADRTTEKGWGRAGTSNVPLYYAAQCQWGMAVLGAPETRLLALHGGTNGRPDLAFCEYKIPADKALQARLLAAGLRFTRELTTAKEAS